jgi:uncharacterized protein YjiS (DUF1127 family)
VTENRRKLSNNYSFAPAKCQFIRHMQSLHSSKADPTIYLGNSSTYIATVQVQHPSLRRTIEGVFHMTQPLQMFENLSSETTPAGGNALAKIGFSSHDRRLIEMNARYARAAVVAEAVSSAIVWVSAQYKRLVTTVKADFRLRAAEAQLFRMSDRDLADLGLCRADIPFAVREAAAQEAAAGETPLIAGASAPVMAANQNLRHVAA